MVMPPGVAAPWQRGELAPARQAATRAERDALARAVAVRRGRMVRQLEVLLARDLADESRDLAAWYLAETREAKSMARLDELAEDFRAEAIRPRRWWDADPAATAELDGDSEVWEAELVDDPSDLMLAIETAPASRRAAARERGEPGPVTLLPHDWPRGWSLRAPDGRCQVYEELAGRCPEHGTRQVPLAAVCELHYARLQIHQAAR